MFRSGPLSVTAPIGLAADRPNLFLAVGQVPAQDHKRRLAVRIGIGPLASPLTFDVPIVVCDRRVECREGFLRLGGVRRAVHVGRAV